MTGSESAAVVEAGSKTVKRWERPQLPSRYQGGGIALGSLFLVGALTLAAIPFFATGGYGVGGAMALIMLFWPVAGAFLLIGMWIVSVCLVLREIRLKAFEAAIRGGDLVEVEVPLRPKG